MRAITIQQPWAWCTVHGTGCNVKDVENRAQGTRHRGLLAIHAGTRWSVRGGRDHRVIRAWRDAVGMEELLVNSPGIRYGAVIGVVDLASVHTTSRVQAARDGTPPGARCCQSLWADDLYERAVIAAHLVLTDPVALPLPIPCFGQRRVWDLPDDTARQVQAQLDAIKAAAP